MYKPGYLRKSLSIILTFCFLMFAHIPASTQVHLEKSPQKEVLSDSTETKTSLKEFFKDIGQKESYEDRAPSNRNYNIIFYVVYIYLKVFGQYPSR